MQMKKGISLIVLVITIIVMIILAGAVIISLNNSGIIDRVKGTVTKYNEQELITQIKVAKLSYEAEKLKNSSLTLASFVEQELENVYGEDITVEQGNKSITVTFDGSNTSYKLLPNEKLIKLMSTTSVYGKLVEQESTLYLCATNKDGYQKMGDYRISHNWNKDYIQKVVIEEPIAPSGLSFTELTNLEDIENIENLHTENTTFIVSMFYLCSKLTKLDLSHFDTSKVTTMEGCFGTCRRLSYLDISSFDTSKVENMGGMFSGCSSLKNLNITGFDTSNVTSMSSIFHDCISLTSLDVSHFDTSNVTTMWRMFDGCEKLKTLDVSSFNTSNVTTMWRMIYNCPQLEKIDLSNFDTKKVTNMEELFANCPKLKEIDISNFTIGEDTVCTYWFRYISTSGKVLKATQEVANILMENNSNLTSANFEIVD